MSDVLLQHETEGSPFSMRTPWLRLIPLLVLWAAAYRSELAFVLWSAGEFSEWTHVYCFPIVAIAYLWCRRDDLREAPVQTSIIGLMLVLLSVVVWLACAVLGLFGYLALLAMLIAAAGVILLGAGARVFKVLVPILIMFGACLPLFERSMDRFSISIQGTSVRMAAAATDAISGLEASVAGTGNLVRCRRGDREVLVGEGEQRFGFRLAPACALVAVFTLFSRRRTPAQLVFLVLIAPPVLLAVNVLRIVVWTTTALVCANPLLNSTPRNISAAAALLATYLAFILSARLAEAFFGLLSRYLYVEDDDDVTEMRIEPAERDRAEVATGAHQRMFNRQVVACAGVLLAMAIAMRPAAGAAFEALQKRPVPIRKPLAELDRQSLGDFRFLNDRKNELPGDPGTTEYIVWRFSPPAADIGPVHMAHLLVFYYTDRGRTPLVPHTPEVCYRQSDSQIVAMGGTTLTVSELGADRADVSVKYVRFTQPQQHVDLCVIYVFCVNGRFISDREWARLDMAMPWNRALYFSKIECAVELRPDGDLEPGLKVASRLMSTAIRELVAHHFPTEADIKNAR